MAEISKPQLNIRGISKILRSYQGRVDGIGEAMAKDGPGNYRYVARPHRFTARGYVETADAETAASDAQTAELMQRLGRAIK